MFDWVYKKRLKDDLEAWVAKGWVSSAGAADILREQDQDDGRSRLPMALAGIGMMCVALAMFAFIAANWAFIPKPVKLFGIAALLVVSHGLAAFAMVRGRKAIADLMTGFATLVFVGGMALVGQMYHLPADWAGGAFLVCVGALAAAWLAGSKASLTVAGVAAMVWQISRSDIGLGNPLGDLAGLLFFAAVLVHAIVFPARLSRWLAISLLWVTYGRWFADTAGILAANDGVLTAMALAGAGSLAIAMVLFDPVADLLVKWSSDRPVRSHGHWLMMRSMQDAGILIACVLIVAGLALLPEFSQDLSLKGLLPLPASLPLCAALLLLGAGLLLSFKTAKSQALFAAAGIALVAILTPVFTGAVIVVSALSLVALTSLCALGTWFNNRFWMLCAYLGLTAVALWLLEETIGSLLDQSLFFLVAGLLLLGMAFWLARVFRSGNGRPEKGTPAKEARS